MTREGIFYWKCDRPLDAEAKRRSYAAGHYAGEALAAAERHSKCVGMLLKRGMEAAPYRSRGLRFLACGTDVGCLRTGLAEAYSAGDPAR